jgi:diaminopimelate epimerase
MQQKIQFTKMHGLGNDFMVVDATAKPLRLTPAQIQALADRHRGIGFDQLLVLAPAPDKSADFTYLIFNSDGSAAEQCGNGARCMARFIQRQGLSQKTELRLLTAGKITQVVLEADHEVTVEIGEPYFEPSRIPFQAPQAQAPYTITVVDRVVTFYVAGVGNPHAVIIVADIATAPVQVVGEALTRHPVFPEGANIGFMQIVRPDHIQLRVYERGVGPTLACGSGACAAVAVGRQHGLLQEQVRVSQEGGDLCISWQGQGSSIRMKGPAEFVYQGETVFS